MPRSTSARNAVSKIDELERGAQFQKLINLSEEQFTLAVSKVLHQLERGALDTSCGR